MKSSFTGLAWELVGAIVLVSLLIRGKFSFAGWTPSLSLPALKNTAHWRAYADAPSVTHTTLNVRVANVRDHERGRGQTSNSIFYGILRARTNERRQEALAAALEAVSCGSMRPGNMTR